LTQKNSKAAQGNDEYLSMKILLLTSSLGSGGAERVATTLANAWASGSDEVILVPTFSGGGESFYILSDSVKLIFLSQLAGLASSNSKRYVQRFFALRKLVCDQRPDVVVSFLPNVNIAALLVNTFSGVPSVICERSDPTQQPIGTLWALACKALYRMADCVVVQTESVAGAIGQLYGGLRNVTVIPNPIPQALDRWQVSADREGPRRVLLSMGRLAKEKQVQHIISTFALVQTDHPEWDLHIYGDGPMAESLRKQVQQAGLAERIFFKGNTPEPWAVMAQADAFVMTSAYEGFPNALLEAMAVGLPCVAYDCRSGPRELSRDGQDALLVAPNIESDLRNALHNVMNNSTLRQTLGEQARQSVLARYSLSTVLAMWDEVFATVGVRR
jgi:GalNAc-alpha-(1->4)-GalNAc-alpha-(1->3)-diNAcBac-PP-undecaprenol alpha-1,4-N-acetyl-D-galactosaminyltransferase